MTQRELILSDEFDRKWMRIPGVTKLGNDVYVNRNNPLIQCSPSCGDWSVWTLSPQHGYLPFSDSCLCTYEYMMNNF